MIETEPPGAEGVAEMVKLIHKFMFYTDKTQRPRHRASSRQPIGLKHLETRGRV